MYRCAVGLSLCLVTAGCFVPPDAKADVGLGAEFETRRIHRGMTQIDRPIIRPRMTVRLPTVNGDNINLLAAATMELTNNNGDRPCNHPKAATTKTNQ